MFGLPRVARIVATCALCASLSGCFLQNVLSRIVTTTIGETVQTVLDLVFSGGTGAVCDTFGGYGYLNCTYIINGQIVGTTASLIGEFGVLGVLIDPVVIEVPAAATNISGTYTLSGVTQNLLITPVVGTLKADIATNYVAEPGTKLVVVEFPVDPPINTTYAFTFHFELSGNVATVPMKAVFAAKVNSGGQTYYPPLLPCSADFTTFPGVTMTQSAGFQAVVVPSALSQGCAGRTYQFAAAPPAGAQSVPTLAPWGGSLLALLLIMLVAIERRRSRRRG